MPISPKPNFNPKIILDSQKPKFLTQTSLSTAIFPKTPFLTRKSLCTAIPPNSIFNPSLTQKPFRWLFPFIHSIWPVWPGLRVLCTCRLYSRYWTAPNSDNPDNTYWLNLALLNKDIVWNRFSTCAKREVFFVKFPFVGPCMNYIWWSLRAKIPVICISIIYYVWLLWKRSRRVWWWPWP